MSPDASRTRLYLHTSPEFAAKKLLAAGEQRLFTFARVFRNRERGALHHPEFTMLEWYRANEPYGMLIEDCAALLAAAAAAAGTNSLSFRGRTADPFAPGKPHHRQFDASARCALRRPVNTMIAIAPASPIAPNAQSSAINIVFARSCA